MRPSTLIFQPSWPFPETVLDLWPPVLSHRLQDHPQRAPATLTLGRLLMGSRAKTGSDGGPGCPGPEGATAVTRNSYWQPGLKSVTVHLRSVEVRTPARVSTRQRASAPPGGPATGTQVVPGEHPVGAQAPPRGACRSGSRARALAVPVAVVVGACSTSTSRVRV